MKASDLLVQCLENEGVSRVYGLPGEEMEDLLFSIRDSSITFIPTRHEQGAAFMADVHGRLTGEAGVCLATLGPGATNLLTGVADAHLDKSPLVAITAQGGLERLHKESHQTIDVVDMFDPVTKWNTQITDPDIIPECVRKAFKFAEIEKPGVTHLELPEDVAGQHSTKHLLHAQHRTRTGRPTEADLEEVHAELKQADRPLIIAGNGAVRTDASEHLRRICSCAGIPVVSTYMGKGAISDRSDRSLMTLDSGSNAEAAEAVGRADMILTVGYDIAEHDPADWNRNPDGPIIHIDSEPAEVYSPDLEIIADIATTLRELADRCEADVPDCDTTWYQALRERIVEHTQESTSSEAPFNLRELLPVLREEMDARDVLVSDVGSHKMAIAQHFPTYEPNTCIISNGFASMGIAVPGALAADQVVDSNVVAATGDGGFLMNAAEIETAVRTGCEFTIVVFRDDDYGLISEKQQNHTGESFGTELSNPDLVTMAKSYEINGYRPETTEQFRRVLKESLEGGLSLIDVEIEG
jgi:acetolactate synthase-1/2/3 large subunit